MPLLFETKPPFPVSPVSAIASAASGVSNLPGAPNADRPARPAPSPASKARKRRTPSLALAAEPWTLPLSQVRDADAPRTGTPAARLGELLHAGFPVPRGFVATVHAQAAFLAAKDATDTNDKTDAALPPDLADALRAAYDALADIGGPDLPVTVRASRSEAARSADDARSTATRRGAGPVLEAVRQCWLGAQRAGAGPVAVVVQRLVASEAAGLAFTADPATGDLGRVLVEARLGVADDGLDPLAPRDWFVVDKTTGAIVETQLAAKPSRAVPAEGGAGLVVEAVPADRALLPSLVPEEVMRLAAAATAIEEHAGGPQEVRFAYEWVRDQRRLRILGCAPLPMETV